MHRLEFVCPACGQTIEVNESMRETILNTGCPVCTTTVSGDDFVAGE
ncbi:DUF7560 family zinc ribbon protein [Halalkalirubrum salinum]|nr:zinc ribbon domain-containing protein [Halalkalirubrum salinum]